ncbi:MAG TPA: SRPBCC family protein [Rhodopila sp.]|nr:SRPBCC family protein [Rhodopila sp.]
MEITRTVKIAYSAESVWQALCDVHLVADCLPGASITGVLGEDRYKGRFQMKVGPLAASFDGEVGIERWPETLSAKVSGKGADAKSSSRASGALSYRLEPVGEGTTRIDIASEINLAGALAQFGKAAVIQEIANRITGQFVQNLEHRLAASVSAAADTPSVVPPAPAPPRPLEAGGLLWSILRTRIMAWLRRLFRPASRSGEKQS